MRSPWLLIVLIIALILRVPFLNSIPVWYWDEGAMLSLASNLLEGRMQLFALKYPFVPHPPLYILLASFFVSILGGGILSLRVLTILLGVCTTIILFISGRGAFDIKVGFLAALFYAIHPAAIFWNRTGISNNLVVLFSVSSLYFMVKFIREKEFFPLYWGSFLSGLALISGVFGFASMVAVYLITFRFSKNKLPASIALSLIPLLVYAGFMLYLMPQAFVDDIHYHLNRTLVGDDSVGVKITFLVIVASAALIHSCRSILKALRLFFPRVDLFVYIFSSLVLFHLFGLNQDLVGTYGLDYFSIFSLIGLLYPTFFLIQEDNTRFVFLAYLVSSILGLFILKRLDHMTMIVYPYLALGMANLAKKIYSGLNIEKIFTPLMISVLIFHPLFLCTFQDIQFFSRFQKNCDELESVNEVVDYLNERTCETDLVFTYSWMTHLLVAESGIIIQGLAFDGVEVSYYPPDYSNDRWAYNASLSKAKYIVVSDESLIEVEAAWEGSSYLTGELALRTVDYVGGFGVYGLRR